MPAISLNPGFIPIVMALIVLALPRVARAPSMAAAAFVAMWLLLDRELGSTAAIEQMGLPMVPLNLDPLNRIFGIGLLIALVLVAIYSSARRNRYEDAAILLLVGGSVSALFVGDFVSFVAAASLAGLAAAWGVFCSSVDNAAHAGVRLLIWHGIEGLLFLVGVAFHLAAHGANPTFTQLDVTTIGGAFMFAALMIRVGAPFAHVWLKDIVSHASPTGGVALSAFTSMLGLYALARFFPSEPLLVPIGAGMMVVGAFFAAAEDDVRRIAAYGLTTQIGMCVALIGVGSPLALAAAEGHAFTTIFAFMLVQMALGAVIHRAGGARASQLAGLSRAMPITTLALTLGGLAAGALPGLAPFVSLAVAYDAASQWELRWLWTLITALSAAMFVSVCLRVVLAANLPPEKPVRFLEAPFTMLLGMTLAGFFCVSIGIAPGWLYGLMPTELSFQPFTLDRVAPQFELLGAAGLIYLALRAVRLAPKEQTVRLLDIDAFYRGPVAGAGRWAGVVLLRLSGAGQAMFERLSQRGALRLEAWARSFDRPYTQRLASAAQFATIAIVVAIIWFAGR